MEKFPEVNFMDIFAQLAEKIIEEQEHIIGPIALEQAKKVQGLNVDWKKHEIQVAGNQTEVIQNLVGQYRGLFGEASVEACRESVRSIIEKVPQDQVPALLR